MAPQEVTESKRYVVVHKSEEWQQLYRDTFDTYEAALSFAESIEEESIKLAIFTYIERFERFKTTKY